MASAAVTFSLQSPNLPESLHDTEDPVVTFALSTFKVLSPPRYRSIELSISSGPGIQRLQKPATVLFKEDYDMPADKAELKGRRCITRRRLIECAINDSVWPTSVWWSNCCSWVCTWLRNILTSCIHLRRNGRWQRTTCTFMLKK